MLRGTLLLACCALLTWSACSSDPSAQEATPPDAGPTEAPDASAAPDAAARFDEAEQAPLALLDLSLLLPLEDAADALWHADLPGLGGPLVPPGLGLPRLSLPSHQRDADSEYPALRVTAVRLVPCGREGGPSASCHAQVRLVLQPLEPSERLRIADAALHAFYDVDEESLRALVETVRAARVASRIAIQRDQLWPHAVLEAQGVNGGFGTALREALLAHIGAGNLTRLTALALGEKNNDWLFSSFDVRAGQLEPTAIPHTPGSALTQRLTSDGMGGHLELGVDPIGTPADSLEPVYRTGFGIDAALANQVYPRVLRIEDPRVHDTGTLDCVSCHVSAPVRRFVEGNVPSVDRSGTFRSTVPHQIDLEPYLDTSNVHMFSYRARAALVSPRVVYETALALEQLTADE